MPSLRTVERLGTYMVDEKIGSRDGTDVYRCSHALTKEPALAKVLYQSEDPDRRTAFEQEVEALVAEGACVLARGLCTAGPYVVVEDFGPVLEKRLLREKP